MILKGTLAAGLIAACFAFAPTPASAETDLSLRVGAGYAGANACSGRYRGGRNCGSRHNYRRWPPFHYNYYYPYRSYYNYPYPHYSYPAVRYGFGCRQALSIVINRGFHRVATSSCGGRYHAFVGYRHGRRCLITVRRSNGAIVRVRYI